MSLNWNSNVQRLAAATLVSWGLGGCGDAPVSTPSDVGEEGTDGATTGEPDPGSEESGSSSGGDEPAIPNLMPPGRLIEVDGAVLNAVDSIADFNGDGRNEIVTIERISAHYFGWEYVRHALSEDETQLEPVGGAYSDYESVARLYPGRVETPDRIDAVRLHGSSAEGRTGIVTLRGGVAEQPLFRINGSPTGRPADIDGDGWLESPWAVNGKIRIYEADGAGGFSVGATLPTDCDDVSTFFGDLDGDGDGDAIVTHRCEVDRATVSTYLSEGGTFAAEQEFQLECPLHSVCLGDIDGNTTTDLLLACSTAGLGVQLGNGAGSLAEPVYFPPAEDESMTGFVCNDFDGDGAKEPIVLAERLGLRTNTPYVLLTLADNTLTADEVDGIEALMDGGGDLNGDGCAELVGLDTEARIVMRLSDC